MKDIIIVHLSPVPQQQTRSPHAPGCEATCTHQNMVFPLVHHDPTGPKTQTLVTIDQPWPNPSMSNQVEAWSACGCSD